MLKFEYFFGSISKEAYTDAVLYAFDPAEFEPLAGTCFDFIRNYMREEGKEKLSMAEVKKMLTEGRAGKYYLFPINLFHEISKNKELRKIAERVCKAYEIKDMDKRMWKFRHKIYTELLRRGLIK